MPDDEDPPSRSPSSYGQSVSEKSPQKSNGHDKAPLKLSLMERARTRLRSLLKLRTENSLKEAIEEVLEEHEEDANALASQEKTMLHNLLAFGEMTVGDIMIPRTDIVAVPNDITLDCLKAHILEERHTRIPVYRNTLDHVEGFLHVKDLFAIIAGDQPYEMTAIIRPMLFVPPSMRITDLLVKMQRLSSHMAIVVDEYGGTDGLVTLEDMFEEIVGDIHDEHDEENGERQIIRTNEHTYEADARIPVEMLEMELGLELLTEIDEEDCDFETLSGLIFYLLGRVPAKGEKIKHSSGITFEILEADPRRIGKVRLLNVPGDNIQNT